MPRWFRAKESEEPLPPSVRPTDRAREIVVDQIQSASATALAVGKPLDDPLATLAGEVAAAVDEYRTDPRFAAHRECHAAIIATGRPPAARPLRGLAERRSEQWLRGA